jgi:hypothetical protein
MAYFDPTMQAGILGMPGTEQPDPFQPDQAMARDSRIFGALNNINQIGGGAALANPFQTQIDLQQKQHNALQMERMRQAGQRNDPTKNPFLEYETAKQRGYFTLGEGEADDAGFLRYTRERFAPKKASVYSEKVDGLVAAGFDEGLANQLANGLVEVRPGPGGIQQIINKGSGDVVQTLTADEAANIEQVVGRGKKFGENIQASVDERIALLDQIQDAEFEMADLTEFSQGWLDKLSAKNEDGSYSFQTGPLQGFMASLGLGNEGIGELSADDIFQRLQSLQIVNLAPVTQQEMKAMGELFANPGAINEQNIGKIKSFMRKLQREQKSLGRKSGRARTWLTENESNMNQFDIDYLEGNYGTWRTKQVDY